MDKSKVVNTRISSGQYEAVASGSAFTFRDNPLKIEIDKENLLESRLNVTISFSENTDNDEALLIFESQDEENIELKFINFDSRRGAGILEPEPIATNKDSTLYAIIRCSNSHDKSSYLIEYTFYIGPKYKKPKAAGKKEKRSGKKAK